MVSFGFADHCSNVCSDWELMSAIAECHERSSKRMSVDGTGDLDEASRVEDFSRPRELDADPGVLRSDAPEAGGEGDVESARLG